MNVRQHDSGSASGNMRNLTANEWAWIEFLRLISNGRDPALRLRDVQLLRRLLQRARRSVQQADCR